MIYNSLNTMKFFIDTANLDEIKEANELGLIDGVTTNPSLVAKEGDVDFKEHLAKICEMVIGDIVQIYDNYSYYTTQVLAASIRHPMHIVDAALAGADVATIPFKVIQQLVKHPLTDKGLESFLADWKKSGRS